MASAKGYWYQLCPLDVITPSRHITTINKAIPFSAKVKYEITSFSMKYLLSVSSVISTALLQIITTSLMNTNSTMSLAWNQSIKTNSRQQAYMIIFTDRCYKSQIWDLASTMPSPRPLCSALFWLPSPHVHAFNPAARCRRYAIHPKLPSAPPSVWEIKMGERRRRRRIKSLITRNGAICGRNTERKVGPTPSHQSGAVGLGILGFGNAYVTLKTDSPCFSC